MPLPPPTSTPGLALAIFGVRAGNLVRLSLLLGLTASSGCASPVWFATLRPASPAPRAHVCAAADCAMPWASTAVDQGNCAALSRLDAVGLSHADRLLLAEAYYSAGTFAERQRSCRAVDWFYGATLLSWRLLGETGPANCADGGAARVDALYRSSLAQLVTTAHELGRFDPATGVTIELPTRTFQLPINVHSAVWQAHDLGHMLPVGDYNDPALERRFGNSGLGAPLVVHRRLGSGNWFVPDGQPFAMTALFHTGCLEAAGATALVADDAGGVLEFYDPFYATSAQIGEQSLPLATDITAPLVLAHRRADYNPVREFLRPDDSVRLIGLGPHQAGKIPVVMVHGLLSDPLTYIDLANEIRGDPELSKRFEIWVFRYPTGGAVLDAAAGMREQLARAVAEQGDDPALSQIVLVGHSMGGLVAKLQVTCSGTKIWDQFASRPFEQVQASNDVRRKLGRAVFFRPSPDITRVIYIAVPHEGSPWADRLVGRAASLCVNLPRDTKSGLREVVLDNPDLLLPTAPRRPPTSIDLLEPSSVILAGIRGLDYSPCVTVHSIVGTGRTMLCGGPADGVVPVTSARDPQAVTECEVDATHTAILRAPVTIAEVKRILHEHLEQSVSDADSVARRSPR